MANRFTGLLIILAVVVLALWSSLFVVRQGTQAIVTRFGEIQRVVNEPGLYFKLPFSFAGADNIQVLPTRLQRLDLDNLRVQVSGGAFYEVDAFLVYRIADAAVFRQTTSGSIPQAEQRLRTRFNNAVRQVYGLRNFEAALSEERGQMMVEVRDQIRPEARSLGIELQDVRIRRTDLTQEVSQQTFARMRAERLAEAERVRARGRVSAREIRAAADRNVSETVAAARRDAEILQGEGEAERNATFANVYQRDPAFFEFYRSMQAYRTALDNGNTTMVLSPRSDFFRFFDSETAPTAPRASATAPSVPPVTGTTPSAPASAVAPAN
ncbi:protease modulator HflC [Aureimonas sp. AU4]|uniref:protease modulator HflC n=1 Tax=Aureimonas sp. AU4 TaxID=1638163 RepID=UPI0007853871|nr:protease modulator HflC [Aureimonas sp. AU4]